MNDKNQQGTNFIWTKNRIIAAIGVVVCLALIIGYAASTRFWDHGTSGGDNNTNTSNRNDRGVTYTPEPDLDYSECVSMTDYAQVELDMAVTEADLEEAREELVSKYASYEQNAGVILADQQVHVTYTVSVDDKEIKEYGDSKFAYIGQGEVFAGADLELIKKNTGETQSVSIDIPEGFTGDDRLDGKRAVIQITGDYICGNLLAMPTYDDAFVKQYTEYKNTAKCDAALEKKLAKTKWQNRGQEAFDVYVAMSDILEIPDELRSIVTEDILGNNEQEARAAGVDLATFYNNHGYTDQAAYQESDLDDLLEDRAGQYMLGRTLMNREELSYTQQQYDRAALQQYMQSYGYASFEGFKMSHSGLITRNAYVVAAQDWMAEHCKFTK